MGEFHPNDPSTGDSSPGNLNNRGSHAENAVDVVSREQVSASASHEALGRQDASSQLSQSGGIEYRYLTFETELPTPCFRPEQDDLRNPPPEQPDLRPYISPFRWHEARKTVITVLSCIGTVLSAAAAGCYSPPQDVLTAAWGIGPVVYSLGITLYCVGFAISPMVLAPFSEINGRRPMFLASGLLYAVCHIGSGATNSFAGMLVARFCKGVGASTFSTMVGGVISDMYEAEDRNTPMALFSAGAMFGTGLGPLVAGVIVHHVSWRWVYYSHAIAAAVLLAFISVLFHETRGSVLLSRKAKVLNKWYDALEEAGYIGLEMPGSAEGEKPSGRLRIRWKVKSDEERENLSKMISISLYRPFHLLVTEPVVFFFSLWVSFSWAVLYLQFGSIPIVFQDVHKFNIQQSSAVFSAMCVGSLLAAIISISQEILARRFGLLSPTPEGRLYFVCVESILMPAGMFWFGWSSFPSIPWIVPALAVGCATIGIFMIYLAVFNYLADVYHRYASSALAAQSCCRNLLGGVFPLVTPALFHNLGYPAASSLLGGIGAALTVVPWVLLFFGPQIRSRSKIASEIMVNKPD